MNNDNPTRVMLNHPDETQYKSLRINAYGGDVHTPGIAIDICELDRDGIVAIVLLQRHEAAELARKLTALLDKEPKEIEA